MANINKLCRKLAMVQLKALERYGVLDEFAEASNCGKNDFHYSNHELTLLAKKNRCGEYAGCIGWAMVDVITMNKRQDLLKYNSKAFRLTDYHIKKAKDEEKP